MLTMTHVRRIVLLVEDIICSMNPAISHDGFCGFLEFASCGSHTLVMLMSVYSVIIMNHATTHRW